MRAFLFVVLLSLWVGAGAQTRSKAGSGRGRSVRKAEPAAPARSTGAAATDTGQQYEISGISCSVKLDWRIRETQSFDFFEVMRSEDDTAYFELSKVYPIAGQMEYRYLDQTATQNKLYYYRICLIHNDSSHRYTNTISFTPTCGAGSDVQVYPDLANDLINIAGRMPADGLCQLQLTDAAGRLLQTKDIPVVGKYLNEQIPVRGLAAGEYFIYLAFGTTYQVFRVFKK